MRTPNPEETVLFIVSFFCNVVKYSYKCDQTLTICHMRVIICTCMIGPHGNYSLQGGSGRIGMILMCSGIISVELSHWSC